MSLYRSATRLLFLLIAVLNVYQLKGIERVSSNFNIEKKILIDSLSPISSLDFSEHLLRVGVKERTKDTITPMQWKIQYFVKNDSLLKPDIYIRIKKDNFVSCYKGQNLLNYRVYFIPQYVSETVDKIIFKHGCSTYCRAISVFSKNKSNDFTKYRNIVSFNKDKKIVVYFTKNTYQNENTSFELEIVNLVTNKKSTLTLPNICSGVHKSDCIDKISYKDGLIEITTKLRENRHVLEPTKKKYFIKY